MKTTTTTTARVTLCGITVTAARAAEIKAGMFRAAHAAAHLVINRHPQYSYAVTFSAALRNEWETMRAAAARIAPRAEYESMTGEEQISAIRRAVCYAMNRDRAETDRRGNFRPNYFNWMSCDDDIDNVAYDAWTDYMPAAIERAEQRAAEDPLYRMPRLSALMVNAARNAARRIARDEIKHASALRYESVTDADGNAFMHEYIKDAPTTERIAPAPYENAAIGESINDACRDDIDRAIVRGLAYGLKQREIAEHVGIKQQNVSKRIKGIRARYDENKRADEFAPDIIAHNIRKRINGAAGDVWTYRAV